MYYIISHNRTNEICIDVLSAEDVELLERSYLYKSMNGPIAIYETLSLTIAGPFSKQEAEDRLAEIEAL